MQNEYDIKKVMEEIELQLIASMKRTLWSHKEDEKAKGFDWPQWQALKIKQFEDYKKTNKEIFNNNTKGLNRYLYKHIKEQFKEGAGRTNKKAIQSGIIRKEDSQLGGSFFGLNHRKLDALIKSTKTDMKDVKYATLRMANDQYRQIIYKAQVFANTGAGTVKQAIDMASKDFLARGFNCIEYKNGTKHNIADYCDMAIRTANKRANLMGEGEMRKKIGNSLVYISKHGCACDKCTPWEGRVYIDDVWSGGTEKDGEYPLLSTAIAGGLFHPRCHHGVSTYYEGINDEPEKVTKASHIEEDKYIQYLQQKQKQYQRLAIGSLVPENVLDYQNKSNKLQNKIESGIINLLDEEQYAINQYISSESYKINEILRNNLKLDKVQENIVKHLDKALNKCKNYNGNIVRVLDITDSKKLKEFIDMNKLNKSIMFNEYLSFSSKSNYNENANVIIYTVSSKAKDLRNFNLDEAEILYPRNSKFIVENMKKIDGKYYLLWREI